MRSVYQWVLWQRFKYRKWRGKSAVATYKGRRYYISDKWRFPPPTIQSISIERVDNA